MTEAMVSWSSGKDSAWTLHVLRQRRDINVLGLFTTVTAPSDRVASHEVRKELVIAQARAAGLPLDFIPLPQPCSNADYEAAMGRYIADAASRGVEEFAYGDLLLEDVRRYREETMRESGIVPVFPLYGSDTRQLSRAMVDAGLRAIIVAVDSRRMPPEFAGRTYDAAFLSDLPDDVDPCGENGEFHSFAVAGPMLGQPLAVEIGETAERDGFVYVDLLPARP